MNGNRRRTTPSVNPRALLRAARPKQWVKNLLVLSAPAAAGELGHPWILGRAAGAAAVFCLASIGIYLVNDAADVVADRLHPTKRRRPVAAGEVPPRLASTAGAVMLSASVVLAAALAGRALAIVMACYGVVNLAYTFRLKRVPVIELVLVTTYCLWAFDRSARPPGRPYGMLWYELSIVSIVPVVLAVLYLEFVFESGRGGAPEELALGDRTLQVLGVIWIGLLAVGIYAA
jgi:decaprenyl-phosphate phosphoribosyltransferase